MRFANTEKSLRLDDQMLWVRFKIVKEHNVRNQTSALHTSNIPNQLFRSSWGRVDLSNPSRHWDYSTISHLLADRNSFAGMFFKGCVDEILGQCRNLSACGNPAALMTEECRDVNIWWEIILYKLYIHLADIGIPDYSDPCPCPDWVFSPWYWFDIIY